MASRRGRRGGGDRVLESRHLIGLFLGVVLLCAVFFSLGYVMGRNQYGGPVHAADSLVRPAPVEKSFPKAKAKSAAAPQSTPSEWDFYSNKNANHLASSSGPPSPVAPATEPVPDSKPATPRSSAPAPRSVFAAPPAHTRPTKILRGSIVLQVAAVTHQSDALAMAEALQKKRFPAFVSAPAADHFYRVQVGPYRDDRAAEAARVQLGHVGFKAIIKR